MTLRTILSPKDQMMAKTAQALRIRLRIQKKRGKILRNLLLRKYYRLLFECQSFLPISKSISNDIVFPHGLSGIFISNGAKIGSKCVIFQQTTIGSNTLSDSKNRGYPTIGRKCYIGAGAKIIGNVKVGDNVRIGANSVVTKDVPDNATVVEANHIIRHPSPLNNSFLEYKKAKKQSRNRA